ncbi:MAG: methylated-DNA--[Clostridia bacterium]|nr:methylated-DNA--[protein]-cysteine S-methyltransferase [Clostridia bacterium]
MSVAYYPSPIGLLRIVSENGALVELLPVEDESAVSPSATCDDPAVGATIRWLDAYFAGQVFPLPPLAPKGTAFMQKVWAELLKIPYGETATYGEIARRIGSPNASRAVGGAVGKNALLIVIPCHRVVAAGGIGGFSCGIERKRWLMAHEKIL